ncbi:MAG: hypothetical protein EA391_12585 [Balneolaceae bacterium]|nr:MAG: hypothetical protein EA391_12585 [Balneolaceae bacterium]
MQQSHNYMPGARVHLCHHFSVSPVNATLGNEKIPKKIPSQGIWENSLQNRRDLVLSVNKRYKPLGQADTSALLSTGCLRQYGNYRIWFMQCKKQVISVIDFVR